jgi:hypothetical protein
MQCHFGVLAGASLSASVASGSRIMPPIPNANVRQAPAKWMRQRQGTNFCPLSTPAFLKHHCNRCASVREPFLLPFQRRRNGCAGVREPNFAHSQHQCHGTQFSPSRTGNPGNHTKNAVVRDFAEYDSGGKHYQCFPLDLDVARMLLPKSKLRQCTSQD